MKEKRINAADEASFQAEIPLVCGNEAEYEAPVVYFECTHGVGHGAMFVTEGDVPVSLKLCDALSGEAALHSCYSGVFMENSSSSTSQDHPSKKPYRVITVRLPVDLHRQLKDAAHDKRTSLNQLCVGTLLALVDGKGQPVADHAEQEPVLARVGEAA